MKIIVITFAGIALLASGLDARAGGLQPGAHDAQALQLLKIMSTALPLRTTPLRKIAPDFAIAKHDGLTWDAAVAEADKRFGQSQPARAAFLRKYLGKGSLLSQLQQLKLSGQEGTIGGWGGYGASYDFGPAGKPIGEIGIAVSKGQLTEEPTLGVKNATVEKVDYTDLIFDGDDHLVSADRYLPPDSRGVTLLLGENTSGEGDTNFFWVEITGPHGESETIGFNPDLTIMDRTVSGATEQDYSEDYDHGKLRRRTYYKTRTSAGGLQEADRVEKFP